MPSSTPMVNKRTVLASQFWTVGIAVGLAPRSVPLGVLLVAVGAYLLVGPRLSSGARARTLEF